MKTLQNKKRQIFIKGVNFYFKIITNPSKLQTLAYETKIFA